MKILLSILILIAFGLLTGPVTAADPTPVNGQITDSVTQTNQEVEEEAPAMAMGKLYKPTAQASGEAADNATSGQKQDANTTPQDTTSGGTSEEDKEE